MNPRPSCRSRRELSNTGVESSADPNPTPFRHVQSPESVPKCLLISSFNRTLQHFPIYSKVAAKYAEAARIAVRNIRRHAMDELKRSEKEGSITEDEHHDYSQEVQELTDSYVNKIDESLSHKEKDILQV